MQPLFKDQQINAQFERDGYVVIPFLSVVEVEQVKTIFRDNFPTDIEGLFPSVSLSDFETRIKTSDMVRHTFLPVYERTFDEGEYYFGHFMVKAPKNSSVFDLHQDWGIVDESQYPNAQIWCALQNTGPENGGMFVIKGSHRLLGNVRSGSVGIPFISLDKAPYLKQFVTNVEVPAGHALIYHNGLFHGSYPNRSESLRIAAFANVYHKHAELVYHQRSEEAGKLDQYRIDRDFFLKNLTKLEHGQCPPKERFLRTIDYPAPMTETITGELLFKTIYKNIMDNNEVTSSSIREKFHTEFPSILPVFQSEQNQKAFEENGFIVVPNFYTSEEITELTALYHKLHPKDEKGFFPSTFSKDHEYRATADSEIRRIGNRSISSLCNDIKVVCGSYIVKSPGKDSEMIIHQDMTLVDESKYLGINIWCPLVDLTEENGALYVLPGSHRLYPTLRASSLPNLYDHVMEEVKEYGQPLYLKAGTAVIFDQSIIHYSPPNMSDKIRPVTNTYFTHKDAVFQICYWQESYGEKVEIFEQDDNFMTDFEQFGENIFERPKIGKSLGLIEYDFPYLTAQEIHRKYGDPNWTPEPEVAETEQEVAVEQEETASQTREEDASKPSFLSRLFNLFKSSNS